MSFSSTSKIHYTFFVFQNGYTALHYAACSDNREAIIALVRLGVDIDTQCKVCIRFINKTLYRRPRE